MSRTCPDCVRELQVVRKNSRRDKRKASFIVNYVGQCPEHGLFRWFESFVSATSVEEAGGG